MAGIRLELNRNIDENYAFFCPHALIHLSRSQPTGIAPRLSSYILTALRFGTLIDLDGVVDLEKGELKDLSSRNASVTTDEAGTETSVPDVEANLPEEEALCKVSLAEEDKKDDVQSNQEEVKEVTKKSRKRTTKAAE